MAKKAVIIVEKFDNGISLRWVDPDGVADTSKAVAKNGEEALFIGREVWDDITFVMGKSSTDTVRISLEYEPLEVKV